ncbi:MAG TPA: GNAT family N-acetyltransferase [Solirubrobacteraceae bacterium]
MITLVTLADLDELLPLMRGYCDFYEVSPTDEQLRTLSLTLIEHPDTSGLQLIAREEGEARGFATIFWSYSTLSAAPIGVMNDLYVAPHARGQGLGAKLIGACGAECLARGVGLLEWETAPSNARAQRVYDRLGAERSEWYAYTLALS